jgi:RNA polymerase sigma-70 factor (sigma-E family)
MTTGERWEGSSREDELLSRLYQQITELQAARFGAGYDIAAGLDRYRAWLGERTAEDQDKLEVIQLGRPMTPQASPGVAAATAATAYPGGPVITGETTWGAAAIHSQTPGAWAGQDAERAVIALYKMHYRSLVRLAVLLVADIATAEEIVQDAFIAVHAAWRRLADSDRALSYLRQSVVNRSRSVRRHRMAAGKIAPKPAPDMPGAEQEVITRLERSSLVSALRALPPRQREALVLRYYAGLSEAQVAAAMGISKGALKSHAARAVASLRAALDRANE